MKRKIYQQLLDWKEKRNGEVALLVEGARRIGKSYIVEEFAKNFLHQGKERDLSDIMRHIDSLTPQDLQQVARDIFDPEHITTLIYE